MGMQGFLPYFLQEKGWTAVAASGALAAYNGAGTLGVIPFTLLSDKIGSRKIPLAISFGLTIIGVALLSIVHNWMVWILVIVAGVLFPMTAALFTTICIEIKEIGKINAGTAIGLMLAIAYIGRSLAPPVGNSLAGIESNLAWPFIFWAGLAVIGLGLLLLVKETGRKEQ
jgi:MFS family permease